MTVYVCVISHLLYYCTLLYCVAFLMLSGVTWSLHLRRGGSSGESNCYANLQCVITHVLYYCILLYCMNFFMLYFTVLFSSCILILLHCITFFMYTYSTLLYYFLHVMYSRDTSLHHRWARQLWGNQVLCQFAVPHSTWLWHKVAQLATCKCLNLNLMWWSCVMCVMCVTWSICSTSLNLIMTQSGAICNI